MKFDKSDILAVGILVIGSVIWFSSRSDRSSTAQVHKLKLSVSGQVDGRNYVDLGLPSGTKWAICNVGVDSLLDCGAYFAWGDTVPRERYASSNSLSTSEGVLALAAASDAATASWGTGWRMPSNSELKELLNGCSWKWCENFSSRGVSGMLGTSKKNGNSIFLPVTGFSTGYHFATARRSFIDSRGIRRDTFVSTRRSGLYSPQEGFYLSSVLAASPDSAFLFYFNNKKLRMGNGCRSDGFCVRPVVDDGIERYTVSFYTGDNLLVERRRVNKGTSVNIKPPTLYGCDFLGWSDSSFTCVQSDLSVYALHKTLKKNEKGTLVSGKIGDHEYVDLGLRSGSLWATCNVGANSPSDYGGYFAWGETNEKSEYNWNTYSLCENHKTNLSKYCRTFTLGIIVDTLTVLLPADDAATVNWGKEWHTPTYNELYELWTACRWQWTESFNFNGIAGWVGISKRNGNVIFLPVAGSYYGDELLLRNKEGFYLSSTLGSRSTGNDLFLLSAAGIKLGEMSESRCWGRSVRAVSSVWK